MKTDQNEVSLWLTQEQIIWHWAQKNRLDWKGKTIFIPHLMLFIFSETKRHMFNLHLK